MVGGPGEGAPRGGRPPDLFLSSETHETGRGRRQRPHLGALGRNPPFALAPYNPFVPITP